MKKALAIILSLIMVMSLTVTAFAAPASPAPGGIEDGFEVKDENDQLTDDLKVTPLEKADTLPAEAADELKKVASDLKAAANPAEVIEALKALAASANVDVDSLATGDIFDISLVSGVAPGKTYTITLTVDDISTFFALAHFTGTEWEIIDVTVDGNKVTFEQDEFSPYAIIRKTAEETKPIAPTGDSMNLYLIGAILVVCIAAVAVVVVLNRKKNQAE